MGKRWTMLRSKLLICRKKSHWLIKPSYKYETDTKQNIKISKLFLWIVYGPFFWWTSCCETLVWSVNYKCFCDSNLDSLYVGFKCWKNEVRLSSNFIEVISWQESRWKNGRIQKWRIMKCALGFLNIIFFWIMDKHVTKFITISMGRSRDESH